MKKQISILISLAFIFSALFNGNAVLAAEPVQSGFNPNKLIDDGTFSNPRAMASADEIQSFLEGKNSVLANKSSSFIAKLNAPTSSSLMETVEDPGKNKTNRTAAQLIWDASQSSGINPQVILVILNREQSLITGRQNATEEQLQRALNFAMGFGCPDTQPCGDLYKGFYFQLFGNVDSENNRYLGAAKSLMKSFSTPGGRGPYFRGSTSKVGDTITLDNTLGGYEGVQPSQEVKLTNAATAALYRYTPHVFNGNYNFWRFFNGWFKDNGGNVSIPEGTMFRQSGKSDVYIMLGGKKHKIMTFVAQARSIQLSNAISVSKSQFKNIEEGDIYGLPDSTLIKVDSKYYVFMNNIKQPASESVIFQRGMNTNTAIEVSAKNADLFETGPQLTYSDGTILKGDAQATIYMVQGGILRQFTAGTLAQYNAAASVKTIPQAELDTYKKDGYVAPKDGSLIKGTSPAVYLIENGQKKPLSGELFKNRGYTFAKIIIMPEEEINSYPLGAMPMPVNMTFFSDAGTGENWVFINGGKHKISTFVGNQKQLTPDYKFDSGYVNSMPTSTPIIPKDGTVIKGDKAADVYIVQASVLSPLTYQAFVNRKITVKQIMVLPQAEVDSYVKGQVIAK